MDLVFSIFSYDSFNRGETVDLRGRDRIKKDPWDQSQCFRELNKENKNFRAGT